MFTYRVVGSNSAIDEVVLALRRGGFGPETMRGEVGRSRRRANADVGEQRVLQRACSRPGCRNHRARCCGNQPADADSINKTYLGK